MAVFVCPGIITTPSFPATFADATWEQIIDACHQNAVPDTWVADGTCYKDMEINGAHYRIDIIGKNHDDYADGSGKAPLTFQMHDCYSTTYAMNGSNTNVGGWNSSQMRTIRLPAILDLMPTVIQQGIQDVKKLSGAGGDSSYNTQSTNDKLFLLSEIEVFGLTPYSVSGEGTQYDYYKVGNSTVKTINGVSNYWWERSPFSGSSTTFCHINSAGNPANGGNAARLNGVAFAFCF